MLAPSRSPQARNPQARNVGNLGDILKHAALHELASMLAATSTVRWVETHAFLLDAPLADAARWSREVDERVAAWPAYARYASRERDAIAKAGRYRCSSGLMLDVLGSRRGSATLGEANGLTRAELRQQIRAERHANVVVADEARTAIARAGAERAGAILVHVDPFVLTPAAWADLATGLDALCASASDVALVAYRYTRQARSAWPAAPRGTMGPVAETRGGPHEVAAYASPGVADRVRAVCTSLGW